MANEFGLTSLQYKKLCAQEIQSVVDFYKFGGFEEATRIMDYRASRTTSQPALDTDCDSQA
jgi:hypothetical protein